LPHAGRAHFESRIAAVLVAVSRKTRCQAIWHKKRRAGTGRAERAAPLVIIREAPVIIRESG
jgi:hypothetical protein